MRARPYNRRVRSSSLAALLVVATATACRPAPGVLAPASPRVYVTNEASGTLSVIDPTSQSVVATVTLGKRPRGIRISPDRRFVYVALSGSPIAGPGVARETLPPPDRQADGIGEVDTATNRLVRVIHAGLDPEQL